MKDKTLGNKPMPESINPPERVFNGISSAQDIMLKVSDVLGNERLLRISQIISCMLSHQEQMPGKLNGIDDDAGVGASISKYLCSAATELGTAWNILCLGNVPAVYRQSRVAAEFVGLAVLQKMPRQILLSLPNNLQLVKVLQKYPSKGIEGLLKSSSGANGHFQPPKLQGQMILPALIGVAEKHLNLPEEQIAHLRKEKVGFWNPCSHASSHTMALHFYQFQNEKPGRAGAFFRESEPDLYTTAADYLLETSAILGSMLDEATGFLCSE